MKDEPIPDFWMPETLLATHSCFDDAAELMEDMVKSNREMNPKKLRQILLVHGICLMSGGEPYSHAWVEWKGNIYHVAKTEKGERVALQIPESVYIERFRVQSCTKYPIRLAYAMNRRYGTVGPREERYKKLTKEGT